MSLSQVEAALITAAATGLGTIPIAYENAEFTKPASGAKWAAVFFLPNQPGVETLGSAGEDMVTGILQADVNYPLGTGDSVARSDFETFRAQFAAGSRKTSSTQAVTITSCGRSQGRTVDQWFRVSFTVEWYALIAR